MGPIQSIEELLDFLRRRMGTIALGVAVGLIVAITAALNSTPTYQAVTALSSRVDAVSDEAVRASSSGAQSRLLQLVEQRITSSETMLRLADRYDLFPDLPTQDRIELTRESVTLISQAAVTVGHASDGSLASVVVMARADRPQKAADMANELADMVIRETGAGRMARARETREFLEVERASLQEELRELEAESRQFATENFDAMPFNAAMRQAEMTQLTSDIQETRRDINAAEAELSGAGEQTASQRRRAQLRETINARQAELAQLEAERDAMTPFFQRVAQVERELDAFEQTESRLRDRLRDVESQIAAAQGAVRLEEDARGASFEVLERAEAPEYPMTRSRRVTAAMGLVAGAILGVLAAFAFELARPALRSARQLERETGMRPVLVLPELVSPAQQRRMRLGWVAGAGLFALTLAAIWLASTGG